MSTYTTGEVARLCGVTVRTVQYYDSRGILIPSSTSEGGRRLYADTDVQRLKIICFLRELGLGIGKIADILQSHEAAEVVTLLLAEQVDSLREEVREKQAQLANTEGLLRAMRTWDGFTVESIGDIAYIMETKKRMRKLRALIICLGVVMDVIWIGALLYGLLVKDWTPLFIGLPVIVVLGVWISAVYYRNMTLICPKCHTRFRPAFLKTALALHNTRARKATCPHCGQHGYCVEVLGETEVRA